MKIFGIGHNYKKHIAELGSALPENPVVFTKQDTSLLKKNADFYLPKFSNNIHHEIELVIKIDKVGKNIDPKYAHLYYSEIGLGVDFTARDLQNELKDKGLPWDLAKGFDNSAPISLFFPISDFGDVQNIDFRLDVDGKTKQIGNSSDMIFTINEIICYLSKYFTLKKGDLIYSGTPHGVSKVSIGEHLTGYLGNKKVLDFKIK
jgi:acylpyruvate hydrolase